MDRTLFCAKRVHFSYSTHANRRVRRWNLTAARVDLLVCHRAVMREHFAVYQSDLRARLGVTRATISIMLKRMERLGLVERRRSDGDRRQVVVTITAAGYAAFEHARSLVDDDFYRRIVDDKLMLVDSEGPLRQKRARYLVYLDGIRATFGDMANPPYPSDPHATDDQEAAVLALLQKYCA